MPAPMPVYEPDNNPGFAPDDPRLTDFRWRRLAVSPDALNDMVRQNGSVPRYRTAPQDLTVMGLAHVTMGGWWVLVCWSASFDPLPNDGTRPLDEIPLASFWSAP